MFVETTLAPYFIGSGAALSIAAVPIKTPRGPEFRYLAANVVRLRRELSLSQAQLAERVGLGVPSLSEIERAKVNLTLGTLLELAKALRVRPDELLKPAKFVKARKGRPVAV
jgi:DNA-binding XRE family transcriptional regulator